MRLAALCLVAGCAFSPAPTKVQLGKLLFEDATLSQPPGQSCADCHTSRAAFRDPEDEHDTSMGAVAGRFGSRNAPTLMYARYIPRLHEDPELGYVGGLFWDGRASSLEDQVASPLLNPLEMNNPDKASVVATVRRASYAGQLKELFGDDVFVDTDRAFAAIAEALASYERAPELAPFDSRYDHYLAGETMLSPEELRGLEIFEDPARGDCARCHPSRPSADGTPPLFTSFGYANLGVPRYANNKFYLQPPPWNPDGDRYIDHGLAVTTGDVQQDGKFRVPTLRNIARTAPYGHNGYFANLPYVVEFVADRDDGSTDVATCSRAPGERARCAWPAPEVPATMNATIGNRGLAPDELGDLVAFLRTLTDEHD